MSIKKTILLLILAPIKLTRIVIIYYSKILSLITNKDIFSRVQDDFFNYSSSLISYVNYTNSIGNEILMKFHTPNSICKMRASTFAIKEPEILDWMDEYRGKVFWDIGANIGIYSIYYGMLGKGKIYSFEPSFLNLKILGLNTYANKLHNKIKIIPFALSDSKGFNTFQLTSLAEGGALSSFGVSYGFDGNEIKKNLEYTTLGVSADELLEKNFIKEIPEIIKIDVDGIEHLILTGMQNILKNKKCLSVFIEVNDSFDVQAREVKKILSKSGFELKKKCHADLFEKKSHNHSKTYNQIWVRKV